ncbi:hypothetical protein [Endozoicomonas sp. SCSIO W0465]|uniref:hypothetical protein n=1 Tax=Endozoicomonas sp. SCSIO W0465 TaxID=2918516 RepID=UPI002074B19F|nr:hypothetical protein [Endozoicomonas sp. SCSIO W0465]USE34994.1 hypothetical protein MJO57_23165 [Endozoicomonas sp. SCSIO W0465]
MIYENSLILANTSEVDLIAVKSLDLYRVLHINPREDTLFWIHIFNDALPEEKSLLDIQQKINNNIYSIFLDEDPFSSFIDTQIYPDDTVKVAKKKEKIEFEKNNRVRAGLSPALPTAPGMRVRTGRFNDDGET